MIPDVLTLGHDTYDCKSDMLGKGALGMHLCFQGGTAVIWES